MRPQFIGENQLDFRNLTNPTPEELALRNATTPITARIEAYGEQTASGWVYADKPDSGERYSNGMTPGGFAFLPPQIGMEDEADNFEPDGRNICNTFVVAAPNVRLGWGYPSIDTGGIEMGAAFTQLTPDLITQYDSGRVAAHGDGGLMTYTGAGAEALSFLFGNIANKNFSWKGESGTGKWGTITHANTADREYTFLDADGTVAQSAAALTAGRVVIVGTGGILADDASFTYDTATDELRASGFMNVGTYLGAATQGSFSTGLSAGTAFQFLVSAGVGTGYFIKSDGAGAIWMYPETAEIGYADHAAAATAEGRVRRNGANLSWHDGTVATNLLKAAIATAKGDILAATASNAVTRLAVGTNNQVLTADSTQSTGIKWATPASSSEALANTWLRYERFG